MLNFEYHAHIRLRFKLASDGGIQGCPLSMVFIVALYLPWCKYLATQEGVQPQLFADRLKCVLRDLVRFFMLLDLRQGMSGWLGRNLLLVSVLMSTLLEQALGEHLDVWTGGSFVLDVSSSGSWFYSHLPGHNWSSRRWGHLHELGLLEVWVTPVGVFALCLVLFRLFRELSSGGSHAVTVCSAWWYWQVCSLHDWCQSLWVKTCWLGEVWPWLTSRPRETAGLAFLSGLLVLFKCLPRSAPALLAGTLPLWYCAARFAIRIPSWRLPPGGGVAVLVTDGGEGIGLCSS